MLKGYKNIVVDFENAKNRQSRRNASSALFRNPARVDSAISQATREAAIRENFPIARVRYIRMEKLHIDTDI